MELGEDSAGWLAMKIFIAFAKCHELQRFSTRNDPTIRTNGKSPRKKATIEKKMLSSPTMALLQVASFNVPFEARIQSLFYTSEPVEVESGITLRLPAKIFVVSNARPFRTEWLREKSKSTICDSSSERILLLMLFRWHPPLVTTRRTVQGIAPSWEGL
ncbi:uncharacterized protein LOC118504582 isoform X2 [Anopheles stephensi]|uniref:uncharacterized protein LOC118504582 isoform X2 n=1 Tax=Anopheles stephensi TaxID=30069 RepID=UPI001658BF66|nr:uncharacterized protein LOC118504582 isoform X2 [Anopheles stephensi]